jgi:hypothetical protein
MPQPFEIDDYSSSLFEGLSGFWQRFFRDTKDLHAFYRSSEQYLGQVYLDMLGTVLSTGIDDTPVFNKEYWKLFLIQERNLNFIEGATVEEDRYVYDMPGTTVSLEVMQNSIFNPAVTFEKDVDFSLKDNDGLAYFKRDIFNEVYDPITQHLSPLPGVAWRMTEIQVGNSLTDAGLANGSWENDTNVKKGDTLNIIAYRGIQVRDGANAQIVVTGRNAFIANSEHFDATNAGDIIEVYASSTKEHIGYYLIDEIHPSDPHIAYLSDTFNIPGVASSADLSWRHFKAVYFPPQEENYEIDYFDKDKLLGNYDTPLPLDYAYPLVYAVIRTPNPSRKVGEDLNNYPDFTQLQKYIVPGSLRVYATRVDLRPVREGYDYTVDYNKGLVYPLPHVDYKHEVGTVGNFGQGKFRLPAYAGYPLIGMELSDSSAIGGTLRISGTTDALYDGEFTITAVDYSQLPYTYKLTLVDSEGVEVPSTYYSVYGIHWEFRRPVTSPFWDPSSVVHVCNYEFKKEILLSAGGRVNELPANLVRELSLWVPESLVDRYTLYNNYGYLLNRFSASSETYKSFLRGVMYLYTSGPKLYIVESALNVAAGYPVIRSDSETLVSYDNGVVDTGTDGEMLMVAGDKHFHAHSRTFTTDDIGGWLKVTSVFNEANDGKFKIIDYIDENTVEIESTFDVVVESGLTWTLSWTYLQSVTTKTTKGELRVYTYPLDVPLRDDVVLAGNANKLTFKVFEIVTTAFTVTDYVEDPQWWNNKYIPSILWPNADTSRRYASTMLHRHVFDPEDNFQFDDPGAYFDADDTGQIMSPTFVDDYSVVQEADIYRHGTAFCIMDQFLKFHMFFIDIAPEVDLSAQFRDDLANIILIVKPSYTYPYVESGDVFIDNIALLDILSSFFSFDFGGRDGFDVADCELAFDQSYTFDDFYRYKTYEDTSQGIASPPAAPFVLGVVSGERIVQHVIWATAASNPVVEGVDYTIDLDPDSVSHGTVTPITTWDVAANITFSARTVVIVNESDGAPDTTVGFTPLMFGGLQPGYVRATLASPYTKSEIVERAVEVKIDTDYPSGVSYTYP